MPYIKINNEEDKIIVYDVSVSDACVIRFVDDTYDHLSSIFTEKVISKIEKYNDEDNLLEVYSQKFKLSSLNTNYTTISETISTVIEEAKDVFNEELGITEHKDAVVEHTDVQKNVTIFTVRLDKFNVGDEVDEIKKYVGIVDIDSLSLDEYKSYMQDQNKASLDTYLKNHPIQWTDGNYYGISKDDQDEMLSDYSAYDLKHNKLKQEDWKLQWHNTKKSCRVFTETEFLSLLNSIIDVVYPIRSKQEDYKEIIFSCKTKEDVEKIKFNYSSADIRNNMSK